MQRKEFIGNANSDGVVRHDLAQPLVTRFLRLAPSAAPHDRRIGLRIALHGCTYESDVIHFDGRSSLALRFPQKSVRSLKDVLRLRFKAMGADGTLLHGEGHQGDRLTLELRQGRLHLHVSLGSSQFLVGDGHTEVTVGNLLDDLHWHAISLHRHGRSLNLSLDRHAHHLRTNGDFEHLDLDYQLMFGGILSPGKTGSSKKSFHGCLESVHYNGINVLDLVQRGKPSIHVIGNMTFGCTEPRLSPVTFPASGAWLGLPASPGNDWFWVELQFRAWDSNGLLLLAPGHNFGTGMELRLVDGTVWANVTQHHKDGLLLNTGSGLGNGQWHTVEVLLRRNFASLMVDGDEPSSVHSMSSLEITTGDVVYLGGCPPAVGSCWALGPTFLGCLRSVQLNHQLAGLGLLGNGSGVQRDMCSIVDRCFPNYCEHGGQCSQTWNSFSCHCQGTGYSGQTCHDPVYERSCEAYKHAGRTSRPYLIDVDGSGPLAPVPVYCNMTEDGVWTELAHNGSHRDIEVHGSSREQPFTAYFSYGASAAQLAALLTAAQSCQQILIYRCRHSRLLNTPGGLPFAWWVGRGGERQLYWGGSPPGVQRCACGLRRNCTSPYHQCNCDSDSEDWQQDDGLLSYKEHLPVMQLVAMDTNRPSSMARISLGPLRCHGDRVFWNAALFTSRSAYLLYPSLRGETSFDVAFYFKTSAPGGIFLESLGLHSFLRLQLTSPWEVTFSFDLGNGPVEVRVRCPHPLTDNHWHSVRAERNLREAWLRVDTLPHRVVPAPPHGHTRLLLSSQLFVGASASGQDGFLGCLRSLTLNGAALDLEGRAKVTAGVHPGCTGHCSSYGSLCRNGGLCMERYDGYACDCKHTPYDGPFCTREVGAFFEAGTWVRFSLPALHSTTSPPQPRVLLEGQEELPAQPGQMAGLGDESWGLPDEDGSNIKVWRTGGSLEESISFSFSTKRAPSVLIYVTTRVGSNIAIVLQTNGSLQVRYQLGGPDEGLVVGSGGRSLADGQPHAVNITRSYSQLFLQLDHYPTTRHHFPAGSSLTLPPPTAIYLGQVEDSLAVDTAVRDLGRAGFSGCLSRVQFGHAAPLKAALRTPHAPGVTVHGRLLLSSCGAFPMTVPPLSTTRSPWTANPGADGSVGMPAGQPASSGGSADSAFVGGVIAAVVFIILALLVLIARYLLRHKGTYHTREVKPADTPEQSAGTANMAEAQPVFPDSLDDSKKEYFI
uniref:Contactin associated protein like 2b n=1 Tax=Eptatretus burgeri TaxID=7764 RepID=A0A8C4QG41_EPTBU